MRGDLGESDDEGAHRVRFVLPHRSEAAQSRTIASSDAVIRLDSVYDKYSGSIKTTTQLDHINHYQTASGAILSERPEAAKSHPDENI